MCQNKQLRHNYSLGVNITKLKCVQNNYSEVIYVKSMFIYK
jgi:hypothetical protein